MATFTYDVFLSFTGMDTRWGFTGNLYNALDGRGIRTFIDDKELKKGLEELTPALSKAIQESRTAIVVLSPNYAYSSFCLNELATIVDCFQDKKIKRVFPVFYGVDPSDVRHQRGSYGEAFATHQNRFKDDENKFNDYNEKFKFNEKMTKWEKALHKAANLPGFTYKHGYTFEYEFIRKILKDVSTVIGRDLLHVTEYPVGLEPRVKKVKSLLNVESEFDDYIVGIQGIGGVGKSTIARAVYNEICHHFEGLCCFLGDVRVKSAKHGLTRLQTTVLSVILKGKHISIQDEYEGMSKLEEILKKNKVLLVLDDVDKIEQLKALVGGRHWFGSGSRVIITTREERLLELHGVKNIYAVQGLSDTEALELLSWHAFKSKETKPGYQYILKRAVTFASGTPLALEVIGSDLFGKDVNACNSILDGYGNNLKGITDVLRTSFDSLSTDEQKVFLDIACCFGGYKLSEVQSILDAHHGSSMKPTIEFLIDKSLIKINDGVLTLHALIQGMGRDIARDENLDPKKRSRLWYYNDVVQVLKENVGSSKIEMLILDFPEDGAQLKGPEGEEVPSELNGESIEEMKNLKTLIIRNSHFSKVPTHFPKRLRVLKWSGYPSSSLPQYFHPQLLSIIELPESSFKQCEPILMLESLTVLDFSYNECITEIPDVSGVPKLKKLSFKHCTNLTKIDDSVGFLDKLRILDAASCENLRTFPPISMTCLEQFNLSNCTHLESFPEILGKMENIAELHIIGSPIKKIPSSIQNLIRLQKLELQLGGTVSIPSSIVMLPELGTICVSQCRGFQLSELDTSEKMVSKYSVECLILSFCNISDTILPKALTLFANVKDLNLSGNNFKVLDACFKECQLLRNLNLDDCISLTKVIGIPAKLETLSMKGCRALELLDLTILPACTEGYHILKELVLDDCMFLRDVRGIPPNLDHLSAKNCISLTPSCTSQLLDQEWIGTGNKMFFLPGTKIPGWFLCHTKGGSMSFKFRNKFPSISLCLIIEVVNQQSITMKFSPEVCINGKKQSLGIQKLYELKTTANHVFLFRVQLPKFEDNMDVVFPDGVWNTVNISYADHNTYDDVQGARYSGIHVSKTSCMGDIQFSNHVKPMKNVTFDSNSEGPSESITIKRHQKDQNVVLSTLTFTSIQPLPTEDEGLTYRPALPVKSDVKEETSDSFPKDEVLPTTVQHDLPVIERSSCELESNASDSDSDDPFNLVNEKLCVSGKETMSLGDASLVSVRKAIDALEQLMIKDISEVSSDPAMQSQLKHFLNLLTTSNHRKVTVEVKEALDKFQRKAFESFQEFQATIEPVNKLKNFEKQKARILEETSAGKYSRKDFKSSIKKTSLAIEAEKSRKKELESKIANIRKQINNKEMDLEQLVLNVENHQATLSTYSKNRDDLKERARELSEEADHLLAANEGIEDEGKAAEVKQIMLKSTWSTDLPSQLNKIKNNICSL